MLISLKEILAIAEEQQTAIGAFNVTNFASLRAIVSAAEELRQPVILQFAQSHIVYNNIEEIGPLMVRYAELASVPMCVHLDHGEDLDYLKKALDIGFTGVMLDASTHPLEENVELSRKAAETAHPYGASVEAELGSMGRRENGGGAAIKDGNDLRIYTDPSLAGKFVRLTDIDALACSFGTVHGIYLTKPKLDFHVVSTVRGQIGNKPIVMHGGSGVSPEDYRKAIAAGVRKINYYTYMDRAGAQAIFQNHANGVTDNLLFSDLMLEASAAMKENVKQAITVFSHL